MKYVVLRCPQPTYLRIVYMPIEVTMAAKELVARAVQKVFSILEPIQSADHVGGVDRDLPPTFLHPVKPCARAHFRKVLLPSSLLPGSDLRLIQTPVL